MLDLHIFANGAEPLLFVLILDGRLNGFKKISLRLEDLLNGLHPFRSGFLTGGVAHERAVLAARRARAPRCVAWVGRFDYEFDGFPRHITAAATAAAAAAAGAHFELLVQ